METRFYDQAEKVAMEVRVLASFTVCGFVPFVHVIVSVQFGK